MIQDIKKQGQRVETAIILKLLSLNMTMPDREKIAVSPYGVHLHVVQLHVGTLAVLHIELLKVASE